MSLTKEAIEYLVEEAAGQLPAYVVLPEHIQDGYLAVKAGVQVGLPPAEPQPRAIMVTTLGSFVDYLEHQSDGLELEKHLIHVEEPDTVRLLGPLQGRHQQRAVVIVAKAVVPTFPFGQFVDLETFNIGLQAAFLDEGDRAAVLRVATRVRKASELTAADDGMTQRVSVRSGIELLEEQKVPNPVSLTPYRTFIEVDQPPGRFVLRLRESKGGDGLHAALFEADGGAWKIAAVDSVVEKLTELLAGAQVPKIIA